MKFRFAEYRLLTIGSMLLVCGAAIEMATLVLAEDKPAANPSLAEELPRIAPVEPADALKTFHVEHGFQLELAAAEPAVADPVAACFDADGRMFVAEMHGYPFSAEPTRLNPQGGGKMDAGVIRLLEDTNGDGRFDRSVKFADNITWPTGVCCYKGGVFVLAPPSLHYFKDTTGDGVADVREVVFTGFGRGNVQALANNLKWGLDHRVYGAGASNPGDVTRNGELVLKLSRQDFSFDPETKEVEPLTGGVQFGNSFDAWGNRFVCSNSNHIQQVVFENRYLKRNPYFAVSGAIRTIAKGGAAAPVFRRSSAEPWRVVRTRRRVADPKMRSRLSTTEQFATGFFTSATGVTIYTGDAYPAKFRGNAFIGDVGGNLVHRKTMTPKGSIQEAARADENTEFIASTDNWFRPTNFVNGPDGALYILDMYRETIEHPASIPEDIKSHLNLESGADRGRVYRLVSPGMKRVKWPKLENAATGELVQQLASTNSWNRDSAQRLLCERQDAAAVAPLKELVRTSSSAFGRMHALYTLADLQALTSETLIGALHDADAGVREHAIRLSEPHLSGNTELAAALTSLTNDPADRVRFQLALTLGELPAKVAVPALAKFIRNPKNDSDIRQALLTSVADFADALTAELIRDTEFVQKPGSSVWLTELAKIVGAHKEPAPSVRLLQAASEPAVTPATQERLIRALGEGLNRRGSSIAQILGSDAADDQLRQSMATVFKNAGSLAVDEDQPDKTRIAAARVLAFADFTTASTQLPKLLTPQTPQTLQLAAVDSLSNHNSPEVGQLLLARWRSFSPQVRRDVVDALLRRASQIDNLFAAIDDKQVLPTDIERDKKQLLMNHPNGKIRDKARALFGAETNADRAKVISEYQSVLDLQGDAARGQKLFEKTCSVCHRVGNIGHQVAPDLASTQNKSVGDLVIAILDPNREAQPSFTTYTIITSDGKIVSGIIAAETAASLTLRRAEGKQDVVLRSNIDEIVSNGKSLMPEGLEKDITPQQLADVIEFVRTIKPAAKP